MRSGTEVQDALVDRAQDAAREVAPWIERLGRFGFVAKGVVYVIVGMLAAQAAAGIGGAATDARGAFEWIVRAPFGRLLFAVLIVGLLGYAAWRLVQATADTECKGNDLSGWWARGAYALIGLIYVGLALPAAGLLVALPGGGGDGSAQSWTAWLFARPLGRWLAAGVGGLVVFAGLFQFFRAVTADFREKLELGRMSPAEATWATRLGRAGFAARGVAFLISGGFLLLAAARANPQEARGLGDVLDALAGAPFGPWLLGAVAVGLLAYGLYMLVEARYRRMVVC